MSQMAEKKYWQRARKPLNQTRSKTVEPNKKKVKGNLETVKQLF
jgi:hypothetical protein